MKIHSNKQLLDAIRKHEVGIKYPELIPRIVLNIFIQKDTTIFNPNYYPRFDWWFTWVKSQEGHEYWYKISNTLDMPN